MKSIISVPATMSSMDEDEFQVLVEQAWDALPEDYKSHVDNVEVVVEAWPDDRTLHLAHVRHSRQLLGFYHGVPLTERTLGYNMVPPDRINIYREPILLICHSDEEVRATVQHVLRHEIAHHFGISDARLHEIGAY